MVAEGLLPRRGRLGLVIGMVDDQGGVDVDVQRSVTGGGGSGRPGCRPRRRPSVTDLRQVRGVDALIDQPPHGCRGGLGPEHMLPVGAQLAHAVDAVNTNGAGDMFAGAFLYGLARGESYARSAEFAVRAAGEVVKYFGPRLQPEGYYALRDEFFGE